MLLGLDPATTEKKYSVQVSPEMFRKSNVKVLFDHLVICRDASHDIASHNNSDAVLGFRSDFLFSFSENLSGADQRGWISAH